MIFNFTKQSRTEIRKRDKYNKSTIHNLKFQIFMMKQECNHQKLRRLQKLLLNNSSIKLACIHKAIYRHHPIGAKFKECLLSNEKNLSEYENYWMRLSIKNYKPMDSNATFFNSKMDPIIIDRAFQFLIIYSLLPEGFLNFFKHSKHQRIRLNEILKKGGNSKLWLLTLNIDNFKNCHDAILDKLDNFPAKVLVRYWLRLGYLDKKHLSPSRVEVFRTFFIHFLLSDLDDFLKPHLRYFRFPFLIRESTKITTFHLNAREAYKLRLLVNQWDFTKKVKLTYEPQLIPLYFGFSFIDLDFKFISGSTLHNSSWKVYPTKYIVDQLIRKLDSEWKKARGRSIQYLTQKLNPIIQKWAIFYRAFINLIIFKKLDHWMILKSWRYLRCYHPNKSTQWIYSHYYRAITLNPRGRKRYCIFYDAKTHSYLYKFTWFSK